jgi:2-dehydro-3-deoxygluconokinase
MAKVVTFGEIMLRLSPPGFQRFTQSESFDLNFGGGEANVAVSLANYGLDSYFVTRVPKHEIGQCAVNQLRKFGVNTNYIQRSGERLGIYYLEMGASQRPSKVIYDRAYSAISQVKIGDFDWDLIFQDADWFHFTGITPALGEGPAAVITEALKTAQKYGVKVSVDLNYRKNLWTSEQANQVMSRNMEYVDLIISNEEDAEKVFMIKASGSNVTSGKLNESGYREVAEKLAQKFGCEKVAITLRESISASDNNWSAMLYDGGSFYNSKAHKIHIVDRVGGGDSFAGGLIYSLMIGRSPQESIDFATAASCLKHSVYGDFNLVTVAEVEDLAGGNSSGRVLR